MASLKDLENRIASVKSTQKITKAMQMVAAAKLRRAQEAAEAARPYAERMDAVLANIAAAVAGTGRRAGAAGRHRQGPGASAGRLHRRARPVRRLQLVDRAARPRARSTRCSPTARRSRSSASARRATTSFAAQYAAQIVEVIELRGASRSASSTPTQVGEKILALLRGRRVRRRDAVLLASSSR